MPTLIEDGVVTLIIEKVRRLRPEQQEEVLRFVESLEHEQDLSLEDVIARLRERASVDDPSEIQAVVEEARAAEYAGLPDLIMRDPEMHSGRPTIAGTGVTVRAIAGLYKLGLNAEEIAEELSLQLAQVYAALTCYHLHTDEIEADIQADSEVALGEPGGAG